MHHLVLHTDEIQSINWLLVHNLHDSQSNGNCTETKYSDYISREKYQYYNILLFNNYLVPLALTLSEKT